MPDLDNRDPAEPTVSVVIPVFNEAGNLDQLASRLLPVVRGLGVPAEVVLVDDGSSDETLTMLLALRDRHPEVVVVSLVRNFGQHAAVLAGFEAARGDHVVTLDADLQNPPEEIPRLVELLMAGHDLVGTIRDDRQDWWLRRSASRLVNWTTRRWSGIQVHDFGCMLRGYSSDIAKTLALRCEGRTFIPALAYLHSRRPIEIHVSHEARASGASKYPLSKLFSLHLDLMTGFSLAPLRLLFTAGMVIAGLGVSFGIFLLVMRLALGSEWAADGVFTLFAALFVLVGAQFFALGLLGEYIGRTLGSVRRRPTYLVADLPPRAATALPIAAGAGRAASPVVEELAR